MAEELPKDKQMNRYLGDGLYASFDGYQICLSANVPVTDHIFLNSDTFMSLVSFAQNLGLIAPNPETTT